MQTNNVRWQQDSDGTWVCVQVSHREALEVCGSIRPGKTYDVTIKPHRERRSLDANAYCWVLLDKLAEVLQVKKEDLYRGYIRDIGGNSETVCVRNNAVDKLVDGWRHNGIGWQTETFPSKISGCTNVTLYYGSSTYDTVQMSRLIDLIIEDCREQGIEILQPERLAAMMEGWDAQTHEGHIHISEGQAGRVGERQPPVHFLREARRSHCPHCTPLSGRSWY